MSENSTLPTEEEIGKLPRWAQVAFAARCAERVFPLFQQAWPDAPDDLQVVRRAIDVAWDSAAAAAEVARAASVAHSAELVAAVAAADAYAVAYAAANAATAPSSAYAAYAAYTATLRIIKVPLEGIVHRDFEIICKAARVNLWHDRSPIPRDVFGPMWPDGPPPGWPAEEGTDAKQEVEIPVADAQAANGKRWKLVLKAIIPPHLSAGEVAADLKDLYDAVNEYHIVHGGSGLTLDEFREEVEALIGAGV